MKFPSPNKPQLVNPKTFSDVVDTLQASTPKSCVVMRGGSSPFKNGYVAGVAFRTQKRVYYFNFVPGHESSLDANCWTEFDRCFYDGTVFFFDAKVQLHFLKQNKVNPRCEVWDAMPLESLRRYPYQKQKNEELESFLSKNKLWHWERVGKFFVKSPNFRNAPLERVQDAAIDEANEVYTLGRDQMERLVENAEDRRAVWPHVKYICDLEKKITRVCADMEYRGVLLDEAQCEKRIEFYSDKYSEISREIQSMVGFEVGESREMFARACINMHLDVPLNNFGEIVMSEEALTMLNHPLGDYMIKALKARRHLSLLRSYKAHMGEDKLIHPNILQVGTKTGRMSYRDPNLQGVPKTLRNVFIPREGFTLVAIDYSQMEFRLILECAKQMDVIEEIKAGLDPHSATAKIGGVTRKEAKVLNFGILYGMGNALLGLKLGLTPREAQHFRWAFMKKLHQVKLFIRRVKRQTKDNLILNTWLGRRFYLEDMGDLYKSLNWYIQGGCADIVKVAMCRLDHFLSERKSAIILQLADEIIFEVHETEMHIIPELQSIMEGASPTEHLPMECKVSVSKKSLGDLEAWQK